MFFHKGVGFRPVEEQDLGNILKLRSEQSTWLFLSDVTPISLESQKQWFHKIATAKDRAYFSVFKEEVEHPISTTGDFLGIIRFTDMDVHNRSVMVGCDVVPSFRGEGWGTKIFEAIKEFCFFHWGMNRLELKVLENNKVAQKLYRNAGFSTEGVLRQAIWRHGKWNDYILMSMLASEYKQ